MPKSQYILYSAMLCATMQAKNSMKSSSAIHPAIAENMDDACLPACPPTRPPAWLFTNAFRQA